MTTITEVRRHNRTWFGDGNAEFFGDLAYNVMESESGQPYLVRLTTAWSDMFGQKKKKHYRINKISDSLKIGSLIDDVFDNLFAVENWLADN